MAGQGRAGLDCPGAQVPRWAGQERRRRRGGEERRDILNSGRAAELDQDPPTQPNPTLQIKLTVFGPGGSNRQAFPRFQFVPLPRTQADWETGRLDCLHTHTRTPRHMGHMPGSLQYQDRTTSLFLPPLDPSQYQYHT